MIKLIAHDVLGKSIIIECDDLAAVARARRLYAKVGMCLTSYDRYIQKEARRLLIPQEGKNHGNI